jgi:hypothetical protein
VALSRLVSSHLHGYRQEMLVVTVHMTL